MTTITTQLADALRLILEYENGEHGEPGVIGCKAIDDAREALAAYDAQQAQPASDHTPEPWRASDYATSGGSSGACIMVGDDTVLDLPYGEAWSSEVQDANARRIVACVNACAGIPTDVLERATADGGINRGLLAEYL